MAVSLARRFPDHRAVSGYDLGPSSDKLTTNPQVPQIMPTTEDNSATPGNPHRPGIDRLALQGQYGEDAFMNSP